MNRKQTRCHRSSKGSAQIPEFGAAFSLFLALLLPLTALCLLPARYFITQSIFVGLVNRLSHCESRSQAVDLLRLDNDWKQNLQYLGVTVSDESLTFLASDPKTGNIVELDAASNFPQSLLPSTNNAARPLYLIRLKADCAIAPLLSGADNATHTKQTRLGESSTEFTLAHEGYVTSKEEEQTMQSEGKHCALPMVAIPGLNAPVSIKIAAQSTWENLSINPITAKYFLQE